MLGYNPFNSICIKIWSVSTILVPNYFQVVSHTITAIIVQVTEFMTIVILCTAINPCREEKISFKALRVFIFYKQSHGRTEMLKSPFFSFLMFSSF